MHFQGILGAISHAEQFANNIPHLFQVKADTKGSCEVRILQFTQDGK